MKKEIKTLFGKKLKGKACYTKLEKSGIYQTWYSANGKTTGRNCKTLSDAKYFIALKELANFGK